MHVKSRISNTNSIRMWSLDRKIDRRPGRKDRSVRSPEGRPGRKDRPVRSPEGRLGRKDRPERSPEGRPGWKDRPVRTPGLRHGLNCRPGQAARASERTKAPKSSEKFRKMPRLERKFILRYQFKLPEANVPLRALEGGVQMRR